MGMGWVVRVGRVKVVSRRSGMPLAVEMRNINARRVVWASVHRRHPSSDTCHAGCELGGRGDLGG